MADSLQSQMEELKTSIRGLEAQRSSLGDEIVDPALKSLKQQLALLEAQAAREAAPVEERRMVSILFMDMVGSTGMAEKLDPEEWRQIVSKMHAALSSAINAHRGSVAQFLGDGILAFFGSKETSENDPENAIRAALDGQASMVNIFPSENVQLRAGIHTGLVVVGELGDAVHKEFTASGDAINLAARLQSAAPAGGILISHDTYRYVRGVFDMTPCPPLAVKGKSEPLQTYLVRRAKPRPFRSVTRGVAGIEVPTIGREIEMKILQDAYLRAYETHQVVWAQLVSDPGVGKSRLIMDMSDWMDLREETYRLLRARAFPDDVNQPYALIRRLWFDRFQISEDIPVAQAEGKWVERFKEFSGEEHCDEAAHALGLLVGLSFEGSPYIKGMRKDPAQVKGRALVVSKELLRSVRRQYPCVILLEDMQWIDASSWEYLMEVLLGDVEEDHPNGMFVLGAARPEWCAPAELLNLFETTGNESTESKKWGIRILLEPLSDESIRKLATDLLQRVADLPEKVVDLLVERSEGIPYFTEEMINWFIDHGILDTSGEQWRFQLEKLKEEPLPATLQHLLLTRLSLLTQPERAALQRGAIFGRRFWTGGVEALGVAASEETFGHLQPRGFVDVQPESAFQGDTEWSFHQSLLQEVTYESVLKRERAALHKVAAEWLEGQARQADRLEQFAGLLGDHCERAGELSLAADWYLLAARRALAQGAPREAKRFYSQALDLLPPVDRERRWQALLGREEIYRILGEGELQKSDIDDLLELAQKFEDENYLAEVYFRKAVFSTITGNRALAEQASQEALLSAQRCGNKAIEAKALALKALGYIAIGNKEECFHNIEKALAIARSLEDENVLALVLSRASFCYGEANNVEKSYAFYTEQIDLDHRLGNRAQELMGLGNLGSGYVWLGMYKQGRALLERARLIAEAVGAHRLLAYNLGNIGDIYLSSGDLHNARKLFEEALRQIAPTKDERGKSFFLTDLGIALFQMGDVAGAFRRFTEAYEISEKLGLPIASCENLIAMANCALKQGNLEQAREYVDKGWNSLKERGMVGLNHPGMAYSVCVEVYDALGEKETVQCVLTTGYKALMEVADAINLPEGRKSFLENVPENREFFEMYERWNIQS